MHILIVDDEPFVRENIRYFLEERWPDRFVIFEAEHGDAALCIIGEHGADILIMDVRMPGMNGLALMDALRAIQWDGAFFLVSGYSEFSYAHKALEHDAVAYLQKPIEENAFYRAMDKALLKLEHKAAAPPIEPSIPLAAAAHPDHGGSLRQQIHTICQYIQENYRDPLSLQQIAHAFSFNPNYLSSAFRNYAGMGFVEYLTQVRLQRACHLLLYSSKTIGDIAQDVGFNSQAYFQRVFKRTMDATPQAYRMLPRA